MIQNIQISGMTCSACEAKINYLFEQHPFVFEAKANHQNNEVVLQVSSELSDSDIEKIIEAEDKYSLGEEKKTPEDERTFWQTYKPLLLIVFFDALVSSVALYQQKEPSISLWMTYFMGGFFIAFSFFKFLDVKAFANSFAMYDPIAAKIKGYGLIYPYIELGLGLLFLLQIDPLISNTLTIVILGITSIGVLQSILNKQKIQCACLGTVFNLPMTKVTLIENGTMILMAIFMLLNQ